MTKLFYFLFFLSLSPTFAQTPDDPAGTKIFDRALDFYNKGQKDSAIKIWTEIVEKKIAHQYDTYGHAFYNIPTAYWELKKYKEAKEWYKKILSSDLRDNDETGNLMEPHTNYKHNSAFALARLSLIDSNFTEALHWIYMADTVYKYWGFEGSATNISLKQAGLISWKSELLLMLNRKEEAIAEIILELIYAGRLQSFFEKSEEKLFTLIDKKEFKTSLDEALKSITIQPTGDSTSTASFFTNGATYRISLSKKYPDWNIPHYRKTIYLAKDSTVNKEMVIGYITRQNFYKKLSN